jgi:DNA-binding transcriptional LysR family regulator
VAAFAQNHVPLNRYQMVEHFQTAAALTVARVGFAFLPASAKKFVPEGVVLHPPSFSISPFDTFALWLTENSDPLILRVLNLLKEVSRDLQE